ncbi:MAG: HNH endonuclease [Chloroflexi bacterium]|nr:HNH endonuclease [Chloroflexota bacterium]
MKYYIGVTDFNWFEHLANLQPDEVNFWQPSATTFKTIETNEPFLFKLKSPHNVIVGGGFFARYVKLPLDLTWEAFQEKNGTSNFESFSKKILKYRDRHHNIEPNPEIGCIILSNPFFFPEHLWVPQPTNWSSNIVTGKTYNTANNYEAEYWEKIQVTLNMVLSNHQQQKNQQYIAEKERSGSEYLTRPRLGQGGFRAVITDVYSRRCAITGERTLPVLEAAHIKPYSNNGPHSIDNGLLMRVDLHRLFDKGYVTVTPQFHLEVSRRIREEFENGREYYALHGSKLKVLPHDFRDYPNAQYLAWHNEKIYQA